MEDSQLKTTQNSLKKPISTKAYLTFVVIVFLIGLSIGFFLNFFEEKDEKNADNEFRLSENYKFTNPLLDCEVNQNYGISEYNPSREEVRHTIAESVKNGKIDYAAVYFRDLNNGPWFGINEEKFFSPASLLKIPVMIAFFKEMESDPNLASKEILYDKEITKNKVDQQFPPENEIKVGQKYKISDLIYRMIVYSDNQALGLLGNNINSDKVGKVISDLGIEYLGDGINPDYISVKAYASFFRVLFNSSYLDRDSSERALEILHEVKFDKGIIQGVPTDIPVAHKFGEMQVPGVVKQLHDCGIVYYPKHPYLLCVMTKGQDWNNLSEVIGEISKEIYTDINQRYAGK
jgi:beta-lactamase class A